MNIPFTTSQFFGIIENYNEAVFPTQILLVLLGFGCLFLLHSSFRLRDRLTGTYLGFLWIWMGAAYHLAFFTRINPAAYLFGALFIIQGLLFLYETWIRKSPQFRMECSATAYTGYFFLWFGLVIYPVLTYFIESTRHTTIVMGLPCPTTILTFGLLLIAGKTLPKYLLIIPFLWALVGTTAAFKFGVIPDYMLILAAVITVILRFIKKRQKEAGVGEQTIDYKSST
ncbi:MAG: DUF6064 family protein [Bacteroidales bacterium]|nr:DUF6064 family protein [Bacteroidales bacterium]HNW73097.1 DUF6064 family protein [Bacteroidales bacterium]HPS50286.1 DUF6064 family protein [Bacteroidales bacterium]